MLSDDLDKMFFELLGSDDFSILKKYLVTKYELDECSEEFILPNVTQISEYITFNNPNRNAWEHTEDMLEYINLQHGEAVADVGCGSGFFTYRFAKAVGEEGIIYATEINKDALCFVEEIRDRLGLTIKTVVSALNDICLPPDSVDTIFMCSMYHAVYVASIEYVKDAFISSIKKALRKGGRLIIVDNDITTNATPYFGSAICRELVIAQLRYYGFELYDSINFIPQRYILSFKVRD